MVIARVAAREKMWASYALFLAARRLAAMSNISLSAGSS
jgi:hypothetical protein